MSKQGETEPIATWSCSALVVLCCRFDDGYTPSAHWIGEFILDGPRANERVE